MPLSKYPAVEEAAHVAARGLLDGANQVDGLDAAAGVVTHVAANGSPKTRFSEFSAQHMQYGSALLIEMAIEKFDRIAVIVADDRPPVTLAIFFEIELNPLENVV